MNNNLKNYSAYYLGTLLERNFAKIICRNSVTRNGAEVIIRWDNKDLMEI